MFLNSLKKIFEPKKTRQAILFAMHYPSNKALEEFQKIKESTLGIADCFVSYDNRDGKVIDQAISRESHWIFSEEDMSQLVYYIKKGQSLTPGGNHWPVIRFAKERAYDYYWNIEYDVKFIGDWKLFFSHFANAKDDFITSHIRSFRQEPYWYYWPTLFHPEKKINRLKYLRSFNPIYRISHRALEYIDKMHEDKWMGHHEVLIPTLLRKGRFKLRDFGGTGRFVRFGERNLFYIDSSSPALFDGSMRYRPEVASFQEYKNKLAHPVK